MSQYITCRNVRWRKRVRSLQKLLCRCFTCQGSTKPQQIRIEHFWMQSRKVLERLHQYRLHNYTQSNLRTSSYKSWERPDREIKNKCFIMIMKHTLRRCRKRVTPAENRTQIICPLWLNLQWYPSQFFLVSDFLRAASVSNEPRLPSYLCWDHNEQQN